MQPTPPVEREVFEPKFEPLLKAGVHFGYARTRRHPRMRPFIAGVKSNMEIFQLDKVWDHLELALAYAEQLGKDKHPMLWVGSKPAAAPLVKTAALALGHPYVTTRWLGGMLTNHKIIRDRINHWQDLLSKQKSGELQKYTKHEQLRIQREIDRLTRDFDGVANLNGIPKAMFVIDAGEESIAVAEAKVKNVPIIALINSDCDPASVTYPILGNDNASKSINFVINKIVEAYRKGLSEAHE